MTMLLDGGMGQELQRRSTRAPSPAWSAQVLLDEPDLVEEVHRDFIEAGAEAITINSYSCTPERLSAYGLGARFEELQARAIETARRAAAGSNVKILGSLPPLYSSYSPELNANEASARRIYDQVAEIQAEGVDILLAETLGSLTEMRAATKAMLGRGKPVWVSVTLADDLDAALRSGEPLADALALAEDLGVDAFLVNCSMPETIGRAFEVLQGSRLRLGAYANGFAGVPKLKPGDIVAEIIEGRSDLGPEAYADHATGWIAAGAEIVGGCCEVGPAHIAELARRLNTKRGSA